jgi:hypothetical protein
METAVVKRLLFLAPALLLLACGGGSDSAAEPSRGPVPAEPTDAASAVAPETGLNTAALIQLIYWDDPLSPVQGEPPDYINDRLDELLTADPAVADPYLIDLAAVPGPLRDRVFDHLKQRFDRPAALSVHDIPDLFAAHSPLDDAEDYLRFKTRIYSTLQPQLGGFLATQHPRTVSAQEVYWGGVLVDGIPPLELPGFVTAQQASDWIFASDEVIGVEINGDARAYPIRIIAWHEMVNDTVGGVPVSLAYCTLCGTAILYDGRVDGTVYRFGTSGLLYRSNKLMWDRLTRTLWDQFTGEPVWGSLVGSGVEVQALPSVYTTFGDWLEDHPDTTVLDIETGFLRDYGSGVAYAAYNASPDALFAVPISDDRLRQKAMVYVIGRDGEDVAYPVDVIAMQGVVHDVIGGDRVALVATSDGLGARAYLRSDVTFVAGQSPDDTVESDDGRTWRITEEALIADDGQALPRIEGHNAFWFGFINQTPDGRLFELPEPD